MFDPNIKARARYRPHAVAVSSLQGDVTYKQFDTDIDSVAGAIQEAGLGETRLAVVGVANPYTHWLILLALCRLSIASASVGGYGAANTITLIKADLLITDGAEDVPGASVLRITPDWISHVLRRKSRPLYRTGYNPSALARVTLSSGTTGTPKKVGRSWSQLAAYVNSALLLSLSSYDEGVPNYRSLYMMGPDAVVFYDILVIWIVGGAMLAYSSQMLADTNLLFRLSPKTICGSPLQLQALVDALDADFMPSPSLSVVLGGSHLPAALGQSLRLRLTTVVWNAYSSTEAGGTAFGALASADHEPGVVGPLQPDAIVEIVDEHNQALPPNAVGAIRIRTSKMVAEYLDDEEATAKFFKDGWFYPGDLGSLSEGNLLKVVGRSGEVMNAGGVKFLPRKLEDAVLACVGVKDAAAFLLSQGAGMPVPWLAIVRCDNVDEREISDAISGLKLPPVHIGWVAEIPRNERGKVQTERLVAAAQAVQQTGSKT